jgi:hypothetical protein
MQAGPPAGVNDARNVRVASWPGDSPERSRRRRVRDASWPSGTRQSPPAGGAVRHNHPALKLGQ